jgi:MFS family permease
MGGGARGHGQRRSSGGSAAVKAAQPTAARAPARLAWSLCALALALVAATLLMLLAGRPPASAAGDAWQRQAADLLSLVGAPLLGGLIAARRPDNRYGWLWLAFGLGLAVTAFASAYAAVALTSGPDGLPGLAVAGWLIGLGFTAAISLFPFLFLLFPNGRLPSRRWWPLAWAIVAVSGLMLVAAALVPGTAVEGVANPIGVGGWLGGILDRVIDPGTGVLFVAIALSALSLLPRFRRAQGVERQQLKWLAYAAVLVGAFIIGDAVGLQTSGLVDLLLETLTMIGVYVGIGIAVLRYRLYEIDRLINRTLVYGTLTALLGLVYAVGVFGLGNLLNPVGEESALAVAASTLAVAALFQPARRRIQQAVDRRFNRRRHDAAQTIEAFGARLRDQVDLDTLSAELLAVVNQTMEPTRASLWLRPSPRE